MTGRQLIKQLCKSLVNLDSDIPAVVLWRGGKGEAVGQSGILEVCTKGITITITNPNKQKGGRTKNHG